LTDRSADAPPERSIVSVALPLPLRREFSYLVPSGLPVPAPGCRVRVPFGERALTGVVVSSEGRSAPGMRELVEVLDAVPVCPGDLLDLARAHARETRLTHRLGLWPNVLAVGGALMIGSLNLHAALLSNLGALAVYWRGSTRLSDAEADWRARQP